MTSPIPQRGGRKVRPQPGAPPAGPTALSGVGAVGELESASPHPTPSLGDVLD